MIITVAGRQVGLRDADDFRGFHVEVVGGDEPDLGPVGWFDGEEAFIRVDALRRLAANHTGQPEWEAGFQKMLEYAATKGWLDESGAAVQAHVERT